MKLKALCVFRPDSGCDYHRVVLPFQYAGDVVNNAAFEAVGPDLDSRLKVAELVVWNREFPLGVEAAQRAKDLYGFKVVVDLDDYWELYPHHIMAPYWRKNHVGDKIMRNIKLADAVTVTTARLADKLKDIHPNVHVIPNALPFGHGQFHSSRQSAGYFNFIYAGQRSHQHDLGTILGPLWHIAGKKRTDIGFTLAGYHDTEKDVEKVWPKMESIMSAGGRMLNYTRIEQLPLSEYMEVYRHADCSLVPLQDNTFNSCKSNLKLLEAAAKFLPVICQKVAPYADNVDAPVYWCKKSTDWVKAIKYMAENHLAALEMGDALHDWAVRKYNLFAWNKYRFELYRHIINS
jgi:glycosyltransferase involved in cell wall biosynthesis